MTMHGGRGRALFGALALAAFTLGTMPLASPAAATKPSAKAQAAKKGVAAKPAAKNRRRVTGYHPHPGLAPADEYFGRLGMSVLGVRNKVKDLGLDADIHPERGAAVLSSALWVEDAMRDWAKKYPFDRWLPRYAYALEQMYERIPGDAAHKRAVKQVAYLTAYFPQTVYGKVGRAKLALGIPTPDPSDPPLVIDSLERLALIDGKVVPTLPPLVARSASPAPLASATPSAAPLAAPTTAEPSAMPLPVSTTPVPSTTPSLNR